MSLFSHLKSGPGLLTAAVVATTMLSGIVQAANPASLVINEIFFNPSSSPDTNEYVELRSTTGTTQSDLSGYYLVILENEAPSGSNPGYGTVEAVFNLGQLNNGSTGTTNSNGFVLILPKGNGLGASGTGVYTNSASGAGFGYGTSNIGFTQATGVSDQGHIENGGFTALLIHVDSGTAVPTVGDNYDANNLPGSGFALEDASGNPITNEAHWLILPTSWTLVDSIGVDAELETDGVLYGAINFGGNDGTQVSQNAVWAAFDRIDSGVQVYTYIIDTVFVETTNVSAGGKVDLDEIEYLGRWGNSTSTDGSAPGDWFVANLKKAGPPYVIDTSASGGYNGIRGNYDTTSVTNQFNISTTVTNTLNSANHP